MDAKELETLIKVTTDATERISRGGGIPFATVIESATGFRVYPIGHEDEGVMSRLNTVFRFILEGYEIAEPDYRIVTRTLENQISDAINSGQVVRSLCCDKPRTLAGHYQASGYPDLQIADEDTGRVYYLSVSTCLHKSLNSSLRTLYYSPRDLTSKVTTDACHCLVIFLRDMLEPDNIEILTGYRLVDLSRILVNFKAEFSAGNNALLRGDAVIGSYD